MLKKDGACFSIFFNQFFICKFLRNDRHKLARINVCSSIEEPTCNIFRSGILVLVLFGMYSSIEVLGVYMSRCNTVVPCGSMFFDIVVVHIGNTFYSYTVEHSHSATCCNTLVHNDSKGNNNRSLVFLVVRTHYRCCHKSSLDYFGLPNPAG